ncbi:MAG TPA: hypothetical protein VMH39_17675, partial [Gemmatimonadaceae bacterium]|nr:hypothetical protein [Gemmatimonadaceae bacterium]
MPIEPTESAVPQALLLDTHVLVWFMSGDRGRLGPLAVEQVERAIEGQRCLVSVISVWEIAMLTSRGRLHLSGSV